jgi:hypothetical protein
MKIFDDFITGFFVGPAVLVINISLILCRLAKIRVSPDEEKLKESLNKLTRNFAYWLGLMLNIVLLMKMMVLLKNAPASLQNQIIYADMGMSFSILGTKFFCRR